MGEHRLPGTDSPPHRLEDARLLTGGGRFTTDLVPAGVLRAVFLRSPHAHARVVSVDATAALALPGTVTVLTARETAGLGHNPPVTEVHDAAGNRHIEPPRLPIAPDCVRHVGEIVAMVVADSLAAAQDAAEALVVEYEPLPAVVRADDALAPGAPLLHAQAPGNLCCDFTHGDAAATEAAFARAAHVARVYYRRSRIVAGYLETRSALAEWDAARDRVTLTTPSQGAHLVQRILCDHVLRWPRERLRVVTPDVGGGFGPKLSPSPEQALVAFAAERLRRPVLWIQDRMEHHLADPHARDLVAEAELAVDAEGRFLAIRVEAAANFGAYVSTCNPHVPTHGMAKVLCGLYDIPAAHVRMRCAFTNTAPVDAVRGAGKPEGLLLLERLVDAAARGTGRDPIALRRLNLLPAHRFPYDAALGSRYDSGDPPALLDAVLRLGDADGFAARRAASAAKGLRRGRGLACHLHPTGGWADGASRVEVRADGAVHAHTGTQSQGQGHATTFAQLVAVRLGLDPGRVIVLQGDTDALPRGGGTGGSSSSIISGTSLQHAADAAIEQGRAMAAELLEADAADIAWNGSAYEVVGTDRRIALDQVAVACGGLAGSAAFDGTSESWPLAVALCEVELDPETGQVVLDHFAAAVDAGTVVNPRIVAGQLHGGYASGVGEALTEAAVYGADGQLGAATLMDYAMPRAADLPDFAHGFVPAPTPNNPLGIKGVGELPANGAPAAVANAVLDALAADGVTHVELPMTPSRIWQALRDARGAP